MTAPYAGIQIPQPGQSLQRQRRAYRIYTDQHGRKFGAWADKGNNAPIEEMRPQGFNPPWLPSQTYAKFAQDGDLDFRWDYDRMAEEWSSQVASYYEEAGKLALQIPGDVPFPEIGDVVDRRIRLILGVGSLSPAIPLACKAGDPWILGKAGAKDMLNLKPLIAQQGANGADALREIQKRLDAMAQAPGFEPMPTTPEKVIETEVARSINTIDDVGPMEDVTWPMFASAAKKRGVLSNAEISVAWAEFKRDRDAQQKAEKVA
jgi:hypothetical protein